VTIPPRTYDTTVARREFDYFTKGWRDCSIQGLRRIRYQILLIAKLLPDDDPRHITVNEILERITKGDTP